MDDTPSGSVFIRLVVSFFFLPFFIKISEAKVRIKVDFDSYSIKFSVYKETYEGFSTGANIRMGNKERTFDLGLYYTESYYVYTKYKRWDITGIYSKYYKDYGIFSGVHYISSDSIYSHGTVVIFAGAEYFLGNKNVLIGFDTSLSMYRNRFFSLNVSQLSNRLKWRIKTSLIPFIFIETRLYYINPFENFDFIPKDDYLSAEISFSARFTKVFLGVGFMTGEQILAVKNRGYSVNTSFTTKKRKYSVYARYYVLPSFTINAGISKTFAEYFGVDYFYDSYSVGINALY